MNYRHAFHAGNHADVLKHAVLARIVELLTKKDKAFRIVDAHAGSGIYALNGVEALKTGEWQGGIGRLQQPLPPSAEALLEPYRRVLADLNPEGGLARYPGSPWLAAALMRAQDRLTANELHPVDRASLDRCFRNDPRVTVTGVDAEVAIKSSLPPPERRGLVLIDPPYEQKDEAARAVRMLGRGLRRFATGCFVLWYPLKADGPAEQICAGAAGLGAAGTLRLELRVREAFRSGGLAGSGLAIVNPPWQLDRDMAILLPEVAARLGLGNWGQASVDWLLPPA